MGPITVIIRNLFMPIINLNINIGHYAEVLVSVVKHVLWTNLSQHSPFRGTTRKI